MCGHKALKGIIYGMKDECSDKHETCLNEPKGSVFEGDTSRCLLKRALSLLERLNGHMLMGSL